METGVADNWYKSFFSGIKCEILEKAYSPEWTGNEVAFLMDSLSRPSK